MEVLVDARSKKEGKEKKYDEWEIKDAVSTLKRAEEIKANKELMKLADAQIKKELKAIRSVADLRKLAEEMPEEEG